MEICEHCHYYDCRKYNHEVYQRPKFFIESYQELKSPSSFVCSCPLRISDAITVTVFLKNVGPSRVEAHLENSPDGLEFVEDAQRLSLEPNEMGRLAPDFFSKFLRICAESQFGCVNLQVWYQIQQIDPYFGFGFHQPRG